jgi:hypothetical protein
MCFPGSRSETGWPLPTLGPRQNGGSAIRHRIGRHWRNEIAPLIREYVYAPLMSALPPKADMCGARAHVRLGPITDIRLSRVSKISNTAPTPMQDVGSRAINIIQREAPMAFIGLIIGLLMVAGGVALFWFLRPIDGKVSPRLNPFAEPYAAVLILGLLAFGTITVVYELASLFG